ncbi:hypothetical protein JTB14_017156 [Gonioctena quinquepunctata]|nr:hypothetical protein JTB14_017156 [Gonioctena quinquepunctata]
MPRSKTGKKRPIPTRDAMETAPDVLKIILSLQVAANKYQVAKSATGRYVKNIRSTNNSTDFSYDPKFDIHRIFSPEEGNN